MEKFLTLCVSGAVTGAIYSLVASGLVLSYSATGIFNFAYGGIAFAAAYLYYEFNGALHYHIVPSALLVVFVFAPLLGLLLDWAVFRPLARASESAKIVACIGLLIAIPGLTEWITDGIVDIFNVHHLARSSTVLQVGFPSGLGPVPADQWHLGKIPFNSNEMVVFGAAVLCAVGLWYLMRRTSLGLRMRAVVDRASLARMRGVDDALTSRYAWVIGTMLAALAGVVGSPILGTISTDAWIGVVFAAAAAAVIGGLRSIPLAFAGGLLLGVAQNLVTGYATFAASIPGFNESVPTLLLLVTLVVMGAERGRRAGSRSEESLPPDYLAHLPRWRRALPWTLALVFFVCYILLLSNKFWAGVMAQGLALSLVFMSFVVVTGMGGMVSLAQATFVTAAGLTTGVLFQHYGLPFFGAAAIGVLAAVALGLVIALPGPAPRWPAAGAGHAGPGPPRRQRLVPVEVADQQPVRMDPAPAQDRAAQPDRQPDDGDRLADRGPGGDAAHQQPAALAVGPQHRRRPIIGGRRLDLGNLAPESETGPVRRFGRYRRDRRDRLRLLPDQHERHHHPGRHRLPVAGHGRPVRHPPSHRGGLGRYRLGHDPGHHRFGLPLVVMGAHLVELGRHPLVGDPIDPVRPRGGHPGPQP